MAGLLRFAYDLNHPHAVQTAGADAFTYDPVGNQITRSGTTVTYTAFDMPRAFTPAPGQGGAPVTLDYDGDFEIVDGLRGDHDIAPCRAHTALEGSESRLDNLLDLASGLAAVLER